MKQLQKKDEEIERYQDEIREMRERHQEEIDEIKL